MATTHTVDALTQLTSSIIAAAIRIHRVLGPGLLENAYLACLCHELKKIGLRFEVQNGITRVVNSFPE